MIQEVIGFLIFLGILAVLWLMGFGVLVWCITMEHIARRF